MGKIGTAQQKSSGMTRYFAKPNFSGDFGEFVLTDPKQELLSGMAAAAKQEILNLNSQLGDDVIIVDPEREYADIAELFGGEVIKIPENSRARINPLDLIKNPDIKEDYG